MYGALEGLSKPQLAAEIGSELVQNWRSGLYGSMIFIHLILFNSSF
jgi:bisphosphoglycerate-dependent phosphoglycerate mutase